MRSPSRSTAASSATSFSELPAPRRRPRGRDHRPWSRLLLGRICPRDHRARSSSWTRLARLEFTRMTGAVVQAMRECPHPIVAAVNGTAAGAGCRDRPRRRTFASWRARRRLAFLFTSRSVSRAPIWDRPTFCRASSASGAPPDGCSARRRDRRRDRRRVTASRRASSTTTGSPRTTPRRSPGVSPRARALAYAEHEASAHPGARPRPRRARSSSRPRCRRVLMATRDHREFHAAFIGEARAEVGGPLND